MKQYLVTGYDYTDEGALERRMNTRARMMLIVTGTAHSLNRLALLYPVWK